MNLAEQGINNLLFFELNPVYWRKGVQHLAKIREVPVDKLFFRDIENTPTNIDYLEVQSFEMNVYLVYATINGRSGMVYDNTDKPMRFHSTGHIRKSFSHCDVARSVMKHDSPYDEMIGNPPKSKEQMALPFSMQEPY